MRQTSKALVVPGFDHVLPPARAGGAGVGMKARRYYRRREGSTLRTRRPNPKWFRAFYIACFAAAASAAALSVMPPSVRSQPLLIAWTVALIIAVVALATFNWAQWRRIWKEQNRIEHRTPSDRAAEDLARALGEAHLPLKVVVIGLIGSIGLGGLVWRQDEPALAVICACLALGSSLLLAWSISRNVQA